MTYKYKCYSKFEVIFLMLIGSFRDFGTMWAKTHVSAQKYVMKLIIKNWKNILAKRNFEIKACPYALN